MLISIAQAYTASEKIVPVEQSVSFGLQDVIFWIVIPVVLFWVLVIWPQQARFKKHRLEMESLKKGDKVVVGGGLIATVLDAGKKEDEEITLDLGGVKIKALRSTLQVRVSNSETDKDKDKDKQKEKTTGSKSVKEAKQESKKETKPRNARKKSV